MLNGILKDPRKSLEEMAISIQNGDELALNELLATYKPFIKKTISTVCQHYIEESDDEFSIGLLAFYEAIKKYDFKRGSSLLAFAKVIIQRKIIDYIRSNSKYKNLSTPFDINDYAPNSTIELMENNLSISVYYLKQDEKNRREEITRFQELLSSYKLSFDDLIKHSPKHEDARRNAFQVANVIAKDKDILEQLTANKKIPMKKLEKKVNVSRKTLEINRKYIIAVSLILAGDFLYLKEYIKGRIEE
ncbi:RNA polymerase sigma-I factor [Heyndrickxia camelliae]|uniref:RNA polymerase sigma factor SigI n=1 Tax=Heyndrickxia camelliae TaxID=1707093 RepID=A0A2N3LJX5_9BACI|nr:RNA polymerase sigma-I factor [Heyndrickxia camelliae]PKR84942.1 RNA polymerase sigma-I factor [Heyndrickxia camelliae]